MDRRFFTWLMLTTCLFFLYLSLQQAPPENPPPAVAEPDTASDDPLLRDGLAADAGEMREADAAGDEVAESYPSQVVTLGSMDPAKRFNLMIFLTSEGAGIERAELVGERSPGRLQFIALEHNRGYLGYLGLAEAAEGLRIRVVPDGSPAARARCSEAAGGLQVDDVLFEADGAPLLCAGRYGDRTPPDPAGAHDAVATAAG